MGLERESSIRKRALPPPRGFGGAYAGIRRARRVCAPGLALDWHAGVVEGKASHRRRSKKEVWGCVSVANPFLRVFSAFLFNLSLELSKRMLRCSSALAYAARVSVCVREIERDKERDRERGKERERERDGGELDPK